MYSVPLDVFVKWMGTTMDIRGLSFPSHIIETEDGDLILDQIFRARSTSRERFFPHLLPDPGRSNSVTILQKGSSGRDRQSLLDKYDEADIVRRI